MTTQKGATQFVLVALAGLLLMAFAYFTAAKQRGTTTKHKEKTTAALKTSQKEKAEATTVAEKTVATVSRGTGTVIERGERAVKKTLTRTRTIIERDAATGAVVREVREREDETEGEDAKLTTETVVAETRAIAEIIEVKSEAAAESVVETVKEEKQETLHEVEHGKLSNFGFATTARLNPMLTYQWKKKGLLSHDLVVEFERKELPKLRGLGFGQFAEYGKFRAGTYQLYNIKEREAEVGIAVGKRF